ncbi:MAG: LodA/GoxA family CTQ-dependent oxidase [Methylococcaceae bacterium]
MTDKTYKIYPPIGIARVGNSETKFYIEPSEYRGLPSNPDGSVFTEADFRDEEGYLCRQAARFQIFADDGQAITLATEGVKSITWTVHLANKKASWYTFATSSGEDGYASNHPLRNAQVTGEDRLKLIIDAGPRSISGANISGVTFDSGSIPEGYQGANFPQGTLQPTNEPIDTLGELRTDAQGCLLVLGGYGISGSTDKDPKIGEYANNDNWWDDTSDGYVQATIVMDDDSVISVTPSWVLVGPPSYAPQIANLVTLYDTIFDAMVKDGHYPEIFANGFWKSGSQGYLPNFQTEIKPLLERATLYPWVAAIPPKPHTFDLNKLGKMDDNGQGAMEFKGLRNYILDFIRPPDSENVIIGSNGATMMPYLAGDNCLLLNQGTSQYLRLTDTQYFFMQQWADGCFINTEDATPVAEKLSRAVLENCVGGAFSPGIEMTWISRNPDIYAEPFRIRVSAVENGSLSLDFNPKRGMEPGDITRYMAVPWQADFNECSSQPIDDGSITRILWWWPAQRPEFVYLDASANNGKAGTQVAWIGNDYDQQGADFIQFADDADMVLYWSGLGFVLEKDSDHKTRFVEVSRTLSRPFIPPINPIYPPFTDSEQD